MFAMRRLEGCKLGSMLVRRVPEELLNIIEALCERGMLHVGCLQDFNLLGMLAMGELLVFQSSQLTRMPIGGIAEGLFEVLDALL
eukprot:CAMPEP_0180565434 /NCGR_PEP_ID=MMETSP1037_2-20121125/5544_1 /TAXON_ID=632150 /ORGANISM="Azadinium spinosum, Strain 3D9" /LENGTH=84 /DNA_ID=CAMNT_0022582405 /DNA_START=108 /DNA_END=362 /DNA_ORIENTATION=-